MQGISSRTIRRVIILANKHKEESDSLVKEICEYLETRLIAYDIAFTSDANEVIKVHPQTNFAISLGGDGTVLFCARLLHALGIPILAVNLGAFGFITEIGKDEWRDALEQYEEGGTSLSRRLMIRVTVNRDDKKVFQAHGLNETTISATGISKMVSLDFFINTTNAGRIRGDGIIVATPTGSTGYSLAAGGPIVDADLDALIVNPVCPFTLSNRPLVIAGEDVVRLMVREGQKTAVSLTVDGQIFFPLEEHDEITMEKARSKALLVVSTKRNYYDVIRDKLNWSGGMHA